MRQQNDSVSWSSDTQPRTLALDGGGGDGGHDWYVNGGSYINPLPPQQLLNNNNTMSQPHLQTASLLPPFPISAFPTNYPSFPDPGLIGSCPGEQSGFGFTSYGSFNQAQVEECWSNRGRMLEPGPSSAGLDILGKRKRFDDDGDDEEGSFGVSMSMVNYDSEEYKRNGGEDYGGGEGNGCSNSIANSGVTVGGGGERKGKKKGMPAKNLMAERRRRKKLNDRLYMLRSVVPKISKMDRASILGDAIDYLKELLQRISDLHNELESTNPGSLLPPDAHPSTPVPSTLLCRVKEEPSPNSLSIPKNQTARIEVKAREGRAVNIHMFCARRPGLLSSAVRALDNLGLDIQQAVISCFNGFALDIFQAEQCGEGLDVLPEQIRAALLDSAVFHGVM